MISTLEQSKMSIQIIHPMLGIAFMNFILLIFLLIITTTVFATPSGVELKFPNDLNAAMSSTSTVIEITSENVIYLDSRVVTLNELRRILANPRFRNSVIVLKAKRDSSMGRVADIFDLCRGIPGARINVSTSF